MKFDSSSPAATMTIGRELGKIISPGTVICITGDLGAGKTHFAKGVALGLDIADHVTSPTFTLINEYEGRIPLYHVDAYRLTSADEAYELGLEEYLYGEGVTLIEWPDRVKPLIPEEYLAVRIDLTEKDDDFRVLDIQAYGQKYVGLVEGLKTDAHFRD